MPTERAKRLPLVNFFFRISRLVFASAKIMLATPESKVVFASAKILLATPAANVMFATVLFETPKDPAIPLPRKQFGQHTLAPEMPDLPSSFGRPILTGGV
ncbi:predicted protein [Sclerotinia sclerotiorum 1980 UF-70]|uniref:Uncharacterized protein n=2 Tax=Sclerotinia sclerotiorum (strain ATCC 18683 / 1980 / Ss-1) TaxID=665079 RepID=A7ERL3_SCLS1|nr:predicted protein [Sclerotinia sclerotiorum 1980 UF-70]APA13428.1 hypothetical protein sscle_11g081980 [Sclerotinia sclerotiorum 1980 UF-70]EDN92105.1 predicted protein [Sclerotinia sclerotiorum 1980 UF-70]